MEGLGSAYQDVCKQRQTLLTTIETFIQFAVNFRTKIIQDSLDTKDRQVLARQELDSYGSKLGQLEERKLKAYAKAAKSGSSSSKTADFSNPMEKELELTRIKFHEAKAKYTTLSTQVIDKAGMLRLKMAVDFALQRETLNNAYRAYYQIPAPIPSPPS